MLAAPLKVAVVVLAGGALEDVVVVIAFVAVADVVVELPAGKGAVLTVVESTGGSTMGIEEVDVVEVEVLEVVGGATGVEVVEVVGGATGVGVVEVVLLVLLDVELEELEVEEATSGVLAAGVAPEPEHGKVTM